MTELAFYSYVAYLLYGKRKTSAVRTKLFARPDSF